MDCWPLHANVHRIRSACSASMGLRPCSAHCRDGTPGSLHFTADPGMPWCDGGMNRHDAADSQNACFNTGARAYPWQRAPSGTAQSPWRVEGGSSAAAARSGAATSSATCEPPRHRGRLTPRPLSAGRCILRLRSGLRGKERTGLGNYSYQGDICGKSPIVNQCHFC